MQVIDAGTHSMDGCPILTRIRAYIVDQGVVCTLRHCMRDRRGNPIDLSEYLAPAMSESVSESSTASGEVLLRVRDWLGTGITCNGAVHDIVGSCNSPETGIVQAILPAAVVANAGIYELSWGITDADGTFVVANSGILSVERNLLQFESSKSRRTPGPPTINEIRMWMMDSSASENVLLDDVEFSDEQICLAMTKPIQRWNETPPPIETYTTRTFPFRGAWASAVLGELYVMAAAHYRRNRLGGSAGGVQIDDKNKEQEYMGEGRRLLEEYQTWLLSKKVEINMRKFAGQHVSRYSRLGW